MASPPPPGSLLHRIVAARSRQVSPRLGSLQRELLYEDRGGGSGALWRAGVDVCSGVVGRDGSGAEVRGQRDAAWDGG